MPTISFEGDLNEGAFYSILNSSLARTLFGHDEDGIPNTLSWQRCGGDWNNFLYQRASHLLDHSSQDSVSSLRVNLFYIGVAALNSFLQANVTGPPLSWASADIILPHVFRDDRDQLNRLQRQLILGLSMDGETVYQLTPRVELFCLAKCLLNHQNLVGEDALYLWGRLRVNFWHQRMLNENVDSLQKSIYEDLAFVQQSILDQTSETKARFLIERATINIQHGYDIKARDDLKSAAKVSGLEYALTGRLGKRTRFQQNELSQLVVLAKSAPEQTTQNDPTHELDIESSQIFSSRPINIDLNDDTLLEAISFSKEMPSSAIVDEGTLPSDLKSLDPADQPTLKPLDSIILLAVASSITNTSPQDGLTREETLPYATRVLIGGSTNWQIYTQALLVRSRIEGYRSRTVERGVLQLQALVDQVITETNANSSIATSSLHASDQSTSTTFLPRPKDSESAPVSERLFYIHQLAPPTRWKLEAELADRWVSLGGLRTALEIYERLQMWAEAALCWAASDREDEARKILRNQLYETSSIDQDMKPTGKLTLSLQSLSNPVLLYYFTVYSGIPRMALNAAFSVPSPLRQHV